MISRLSAFVALLFVALSLMVSTRADTTIRLSDNFDDGVLDADKWFIGTLSLYQGEGLTDFSIPVTEQGGHLQIAPKSSVFGLHYNGYVSRNNFDFTGGKFSAEIVEIPNPSSTGEMFLSVGADGNNFWRYEIHMGQLRADHKTNGFTSYYPLGPYSSSNHKFLRIRHDPFQKLILWEASSDRAQWTTLHTESPGFPLTSVQAELFAGTYTSAFSPGLAIFDNAELATVSFPTNQPPQILAQPHSQTVPVGQTATFAVDAVSLAPFGYQWYFNSFFIPGATSSAFTIPSVQPNNVGVYRVVVSNQFGLVVSSPAQLSLPSGDSEAPVVTITSPPSGTVSQDRITIEGTATDNIGLASLYLERAGSPNLAIPLKDGSFSLPNVPVQLGTNTFRVVAQDAVGNQSAASLTVILELSRSVFISDIQPVQEGALLTAPILLTSKGDVGAITLDLEYDSTFLSLAGIQFPASLSGWTQVNTQNVGVARLGFALPGNTLPAGTQNVAVITFRARSIPQPVATPLNLQLIGIYGSSGNSILAGTDVRSGSAHISQRKFIGDNNANDLLDVGDASIIMRLVSGIDPIRSWDITANDLNQNQMVDAGDVIRVLRAAVNLDPQPSKSTQSGLSIHAAAISPAKVTLTSDKTDLTPGDRITVTLSLDNASSALSGSSFKIVYPAAALRLESAESHRPGAIVPSDAMAIWNLSPAQDDYAKQDGNLYAAFSSPNLWPTHSGELAVFTFTVQPAATSQYSWPVQVSDIVLSDGFDVENLAPAAIVLHGQPTAPQAPFIITQPKNVTNVVEGDTATFTVVADGNGPLEYQWLKESQPIPGATAATLTLPNLPLAKGIDGFYQVVVRNSLGSVTSDRALLIIWPKAPPIINGYSPADTQEVMLGESVSLLITAISVSPVTYQWLKNDLPVPGATQPNFFLSSAKVEDSGDYKLSVSNPFGTTVSQPVTVVVRNEPPPPRIAPKILANQDRLITVVRGEPLVLSISVLAGTPPLGFHWSSDHPLDGLTTTFAVEHAQFSDAGQYYVNVTNPYGSDGAYFDVTVVDRPTVLTQPTEHLELLPYLPGSLSIRFSTGFPNGTVTLTWYRNGRPIWTDYAYRTNQYESSLTVVSTDNPDQPGPGDYFAVIDNGSGGITSTVAHVEVVVPSPKRPPVSSTPDLSRDLVAYWPFDDADGDKLRDHIGHHDLELGSDATFLPGHLGNALHLAEWGTTVATYRATGPEDDLPINRHQAFTISFWDNLYPRTYPGDPPYFFFEGNSDNASTRFAIAEERKDPNSAQLTALLRFVQPQRENVELHTDVRTLSIQEWRHVVFVQDEDGSRWLYIDGIEIPVSIPPRPIGEWELNYTQVGGSQRPPNTLSALFICCFPAVYLIDETAVWKRALSPEEIRLLHVSGIPGTEPKPLLIHSLSFDESHKTVTVNWHAVGDGLYSLLKSSSIRGPWIVVTNGPPSALTDGSVTSSFTDQATSDAAMFYQIRRE